MPAISAIRILETEPNKRGDLFNRLMGDLFLALGYDQQVRLNIHKSGREIDVQVDHRTERRRAIAECKATKDKTGGDEINKFVGALDVEKRKNPNIRTVGYFISLSGFKETAIEQEKDAGGDRVIFLDGNQVIEELIKGRIIKPMERVMERAGRCAAGQPVKLLPEPACELLAHDIGWIWAVYFTQNKQRTHFGWAFAHLGKTGAWSPECKPDVLLRLLKIWRKSQLPDVQHVSSWAISDLPLIDRESKPLLEPDPDLIDFIKKQFSPEGDELKVPAKKRASLVMGFYWKAPWTDEELAQLAASIYGEGFDNRSTLDPLLEALGEPGKAQLEALKQKQDEREMATIDDV